VGHHEEMSQFNQYTGITKRMKHNYPKNRKLPDNTAKADLLRRHSLDEIFQIWYKKGIYQTADVLEASPNVIHYIAIRNQWKRPLPRHLMLANKNGNWNNMKTNFIPDNSNHN
jgi:hypothetical protein